MTNATARRSRRAQSLPMGARPSEVNSLARWLHRNNLTCADFREQLERAGIKVTIDAIYRWRDGRAAPRRKTARVIAEVTKGAVSSGAW